MMMMMMMMLMLATREQLLRILLRITTSVLTEPVPAHREKSLGDRLAEHLLKVSYSSPNILAQ